MTRSRTAEVVDGLADELLEENEVVVEELLVEEVIEEITVEELVTG